MTDGVREGRDIEGGADLLYITYGQGGRGEGGTGIQVCSVGNRRGQG